MSNTTAARKRVALAASISIFVLAVFAGGAQAASETPGDTFPASVTTAGVYPEDGVGQEVTISGDGRYVAFLSRSPDLDPDATAWAQAYVKDLQTGALELASRGEGSAGPPADAAVERPFISGNGRYLAFETPADNLVAGVSSTQGHVYRRDLESGETVLVDRVTGPAGAAVPLKARLQSISDDGRYVVFSDEAEDLEDPAGEHEEGNETIYVRDLREGTTTAVDRAGGLAGDLADDGAEEGAISRDGRFVLFTSDATNLDPEANGIFQVFRRDLQTGETLLVSRSNPTASAPEGEPGDGESFEATFVGGSDCKVAFLGAATTNLYPGPEDPALGIYLRDFCASVPTTELVSLDEEGEPFEEGIAPSSTDDGRIAFEGGNQFPDIRHLYLRDPGAGQTTLLDRADSVAGEPAGRLVEWGEVSANGCRAAFTSAAGELIDESPTTGGEGLQVYVRQLAKCKPPVEIPSDNAPPSTGSQQGGGHSPEAAAPTHLRIAWLNRAGLALDFSGGGSATVRVRRLLKQPRRHWQLVKVLAAETGGAGQIRLELPALAPGRYRIRARLRNSTDRAVVRALKVPAQYAGGSKRSSTEARLD